MKNINLLITAIMLVFFHQTFAQKVLTLEESKQLALQNNAESKNSKLEIEASCQIRKSAFTNYFPSISAGGMMFGAEEELMGTMLKKGTIGYINAVQPLFAGERILNGNKLASLGVEVSEYKSKLTRDEILLKTEEQYWQIVSLEEKSKTINIYEEMLNSLLRQVEDAYNSGIVMKNDVLKVRLKLSEVLLNKSKLDNSIKLAGMSFSQHIGIPYDSTISLNDVLIIKKLPQSFYVESSEALTSRSEYNLLQLSVEAEKLQTKMKLGEYLPEAGIGLSGQYLKFDEAEGRTIGMVFGTVSVPISSWWGGSHELQERSIKEEIAENNFKNNSELLILQMEKAWQDLSDAYKQYLLSEESKAQAEENFKVNDDSYKNGLIDVSDLLEAQALLQQTKDQLTEAKANYITKKTKYLQVTGR